MGELGVVVVAGKKCVERGRSQSVTNALIERAQTITEAGSQSDDGSISKAAERASLSYERLAAKFSPSFLLPPSSGKRHRHGHRHGHRHRREIN